MSESIGLRLEQYTLKRRQEVLIVNLETPKGEPDRVMVYGGFSSSLMRETEFDPDVPIIEPNSKIMSIDRLASPYDPENPQYLETSMTLEAMEDAMQHLDI